MLLANSTDYINAGPDTVLGTADDYIDYSKVGAGGDFGADGVAGCDRTGPYGTSGAHTSWTCEPGNALGKTHSLGATGVRPPGAAEADISAFSCTNCHDPHGVSQVGLPGSDNSSSVANDYRMLRKYPTGSNGGTSGADPQAPFEIGNITAKKTSSYSLAA